MLSVFAIRHQNIFKVTPCLWQSDISEQEEEKEVALSCIEGATEKTLGLLNYLNESICSQQAKTEAVNQQLSKMTDN